MISCDDFLVEDTRSKLSPDNFFKNEAEVNLALNGIQGQMPNATDMSSFLGTDLGVYGRSVASASMYSGIYLNTVDNSANANLWSTDYTGVRDVNFLLSGVAKSALSAEIKGRAKAEAYFYRAMFYWDLTVRFGDVPYWREEVDLNRDALLGKTDANIIQKDMIADLDSAISSGYMATVKWNENDSRPTVWSARMLKAYYHVWQKQWALARTELIEVTTKSPHGTELAPYADLYREGNEKHNEIIFGVEFLSTAAKAFSNGVFVNAHYNTAGENANTRTAMGLLNIFTSTAGMTMRKSFANTFASTDLRKTYNVWDSYTYTVGTKTTVAAFNFIYMPKLMRAALPLSDPLMKTPDIISYSSESSKLFRLSEAYLLLAEAEFMIDGSSPAALAAINKTRVRSGLTALTSMTHKDIENERAWELAGEGFTGRKIDLIRWGILESTVLATPAAERTAKAYSVAITRAMADSAIIAAAPKGKYYVYPIPLQEIQRSENIGGALVQNPLWAE